MKVQCRRGGGANEVHGADIHARRVADTMVIAFVMMLVLTGCSGAIHIAADTAPGPSLEPPGLAEARTLVVTAARAYKVDPPAVMVGEHAGDATFGAVYRRGVIVFTARVLAGPARDMVAAHEMAHYVLRHEHPTMRTQEEKEHQANIEAVRILEVGKGITEETALRDVLQWLTRGTRHPKGRTGSLGSDVTTKLYAGNLEGDRMKKPTGIVAMAPVILAVTAWCLAGAVSAQEQRPPRDVWNEVYTKLQGRELPPNKSLTDAVRGRKPGRALDVGMGDGRNAVFLAAEGWEVTGFDISDVGVRQAREAAQRRGVKLTALVDDVDSFDYGRQQWDLVVGMYMHALITRNAARIVDSLRPGGIIVVEGFHRDLNRQGLQGGPLGYRSNELLRAFDRLRVIHYEDTVGPADWARGGQWAPVVRLIAVKDLGLDDSR